MASSGLHSQLERQVALFRDADQCHRLLDTVDEPFCDEPTLIEQRRQMNPALA